MGFDALLGQDAAVGTLRRALASGKVHHAYRFEGPDGVGKQMAAFAFAQSLVCSAAPPAGIAFSACTRCSACTRAVTLAKEPPFVPLHPDVMILERGLYSADALRRARGETQDISVDQIRRLVLERASFAPHEGRARVFIMRRAHELSTSAANALLKTLEEPLANTYFVLLTDRGNELISTIRSRAQLVRFAALSDAVVQSILEKQGIAPELAQTAAELACGSVSAALGFADADASRERRSFIESAIAAARAPNLGLAVALSDGRARDKEVLYDRLGALAAYLAKVGRAVVPRDPERATRAARGYSAVTLAMQELEQNGSPALVLEAMVERLRHEL
jgi:DNA polymerase-3 subunit delta'